jgi:hypothetical protein
MPGSRSRERPESNSSHLAGEYFVAAELYKRGFSVALTMGNAKAIDLFAEKRTRTVNVQVKAIRFRKHVGWLIRDNYFCRSASITFAGLSRPDGLW